MIKRLDQPGVLVQGTKVRALLKVLAPHATIPTHTHPNHHVIVTALKGDVVLETPDEHLALAPGELAWLDEITPLALRAGAAGATFTVTLARQPKTATAST
ncbi:cupin domain-containing protein [Deinococcus ficus]|uniref:Cupin 2 conserved barrel domain-containing protein n=1 Tax=Deinococcus ficus TaxID=317577 RepID=A0A221T0L7_9DEIO|nr:hypothetical protein [Deinococcus ficus]ASN82410.1 hypothetical protein DFI_14575 [Deinococcus ficus]